MNEELVSCVASGKKTTELKQTLQNSFGVSYSNANCVARTELAHIQTKAAQQRYVDSGISFVEVWADEDERRCEKCGKLHKKRYPVNAHIPVPAHPNCRCCVIPVVDDRITEKYFKVNFKGASGSSNSSDGSKEEFKVFR